MPASLLVTSPPRPMSTKVVTAVNTANQNRAGRYLWFMFKNGTTAADSSRSGRRRSKGLFYFEGEILRGAIGLDLDFGGLRAEFAMDGLQRVFAGGHILDREFAVLAADGKIRMIKHADPGK